MYPIRTIVLTAVLVLQVFGYQDFRNGAMYPLSVLNNLSIPQTISYYNMDTSVIFYFAGHCMRSFTDEINVSIEFRNGLRYDQTFENVILSESTLGGHGFSEKLYNLLKSLIFSDRSIFYIFPSNSLSWKRMDSSNAGLYYDHQMYKFYSGMPSFALRLDDSNELIHRRFQWPRIYQRQIQWDAYGRTIHSLIHITTNGTNYFQAFSSDPYACFEFLHTQAESYACTSEVMYALHLSRIHNFTLQISQRKRGMNLTKYWESINQQEYFFVRAVDANEPVWLTAHSKRSRTFASSHYMFAIQCKLESSTKPVSYKFWINGLSTEVWIVALTFLLVGSLLPGDSTENFVNKAGLIVMNFVSTITRQGVIRSAVKRKFECVVAAVMLWIGFFSCIFYENSIVSLTVFPNTATGNETIQRFLDKGYKVIWNPALYADTPFYEFFKCDFWNLKYLNKINESYINTGRDQISSFIESMNYSNGSPKLLTLAFDSDYTIHLARMEHQFERSQILRNSKEQANCKRISQSIHNHMDLWEMYTANRVWLMQTARAILESGLPHVWDEFANISYLRFLNISSKGRHLKHRIRILSYGEADIDLKRFWVVVVTFFGLIGLAVAAFVFEMVYQRF